MGILQKMRIKNITGVSEVRFKKKLVSFTLETWKNHLIRNFLHNRRVGLICNEINRLFDFYYVSMLHHLKVIFFSIKQDLEKELKYM